MSLSLIRVLGQQKSTTRVTADECGLISVSDLEQEIARLENNYSLIAQKIINCLIKSGLSEEEALEAVSDLEKTVVELNNLII